MDSPKQNRQETTCNSDNKHMKYVFKHLRNFKYKRFNLYKIKSLSKNKNWFYCR